MCFTHYNRIFITSYEMFQDAWQLWKFTTSQLIQYPDLSSDFADII